MKIWKRSRFLWAGCLLISYPINEDLESHDLGPNEFESYTVYALTRAGVERKLERERTLRRKWDHMIADEMDALTDRE